jgi:hypothetical protein
LRALQLFAGIHTEYCIVPPTCVRQCPLGRESEGPWRPSVLPCPLQFAVASKTHLGLLQSLAQFQAQVLRQPASHGRVTFEVDKRILEPTMSASLVELPEGVRPDVIGLVQKSEQVAGTTPAKDSDDFPRHHRVVRHHASVARNAGRWAWLACRRGTR